MGVRTFRLLQRRRRPLRKQENTGTNPSPCGPANGTQARKMWTPQMFLGTTPGNTCRHPKFLQAWGGPSLSLPKRVNWITKRQRRSSRRAKSRTGGSGTHPPSGRQVNSRNCPGEAHLSPASREMQPLVSLAKAIGFLGPEGTFTEECLHAFLGITRQELTGSEGRIKIAPFPSLPDTVEAVTRREVDCALVPIENSTEGSVSATLDILIHGGDGLQIIRETRHSIRHRLITQPGVSVGEVTSLISHPHAAAECRRWLRENLPDVEVEAANSTASAVKRVAAASEPWAAIGTALAAEMYGCRVAEDSIEDSPDNETRFILLARQEDESGFVIRRILYRVFRHPAAVHLCR